MPERRRRVSAGSPKSNLLLAAMMSDGSDAELEEVPLVLGEHLVRVGDIPAYAYFPLIGVISVVSTTPQGDTVEVAAVGKEGLAGGLAAARALPSPFDLLVQVPGKAVRMEREPLIRRIDQSARFRQRWLDYLHDLMVQIAQSAVCNRYHQAPRRLARWLLTVADRAQSETIPMTHEFAATMVGGDRPRVTMAVRALRSRRLVHQERGELTILDRAGLINVACDCYSRVNAVTSREPSRAAKTIRDDAL
jgi:CRP-like cAMP-binding protein